MINEYLIGAFRGRKLIQQRGQVGGARAVFVKLQGVKNELTYPTHGGMIMNPFKGAAKMFAGDLCEYRTNDDGVKPEIYLLKTYLVKSASGTTINIVKDAYKHKPFVGDKLGVAPAAIGGAVASSAVVTAVSTGKVGDVDVWVLTMASEVTATENDVLVEVGSDGNMLVKNVNGVIDCDCDMLDAPATGDDDFDGARYMYTPAFGGVMYVNRMSPLPACVQKFNTVNVNGWFGFNTLHMLK